MTHQTLTSVRDRDGAPSCPSTWTGIAAAEVALALEALGPVTISTCGEANYRVYARITPADVVRVAVIADSPVDDDGCHLLVHDAPAIRYKVTPLHEGRHGPHRVTTSLDDAVAVATACAAIVRPGAHGAL